MRSKRVLVISIIIFIIVAAVALFLVLNKGHVGSYALVHTEPVSTETATILPQLKLEFDKEYLSSKNKICREYYSRLSIRYGLNRKQSNRACS